MLCYQSFVLSRHSEILFFQIVEEKVLIFFFLELNYLKLNIFNPVSRIQTLLHPSFCPF